MGTPAKKALVAGATMQEARVYIYGQVETILLCLPCISGRRSDKRELRLFQRLKLHKYLVVMKVAQVLGGDEVKSNLTYSVASFPGLFGRYPTIRPVHLP